jgi:hypothetical protein
MQKVDLDAMSIEDLAKLRDLATAKLAEKVEARQQELEAELARLSVYGKPRKAAPAPKLLKQAGKEMQPAKDLKDAAAKAA